MHKTTVYLTDTELEGLRRLAAATGKPQAELIRASVRSLLESDLTARKFHSMAVAASGDGSAPRWTSDELYDKVMGRR